MKIDFSKDPKLVAENKKEEEKGMKELNGMLDQIVGGGKCIKRMGKTYCGFGALPPEKDLNKLERGTYKKDFDVPGYQVLAKSPTVIFYKRIVDNTIVIAVRGSSDTRDWLKTNTMLPFGQLTTTARYKEDKKFVGDNLAKFAQGNDVYIVGHSLGGAIANQLQLDFPIIQGGITFNPAFQPMDFLNKSKVQRKYTSGDPLGKLGRYLPDATVENNEGWFERLIPNNIFKSINAHQLGAFESGSGHPSEDQIKKYKADAKKELDDWIHKKQQKMKKKGIPSSDILKQYNSSDLEEVDELIHKVENKLELPFGKGYDVKVKDLVLNTARSEKEKILLIIRLLLSINKKKLTTDLMNKIRDLGDELGVNLNASSSGIMANLIKIPDFNVEVADFENFKPSDHQKPIVIALGKSNDGDLHAIIIKKKGYNKNDAVVEAVKFKTRKGLHMRETKLSYRFRNIPKTKFEPKSFRTKKINKNISLVYGKLK